MKLAEIVDGLARPSPDAGLFAARSLDDRPGVRVGVDAAGRPGIFFETTFGGGVRRPFVLAAITYDPDARCRFDGEGTERRCAVLRCIATDGASRDLFLRVAESWLPTTPNSGVGAEIDEAVARLVDLFDALARPARGEVLGLWGELFLILISADPRELLRSWRCDPFEVHDFVATAVRLEVKTAIGLRRHQFSLEQLQAPRDTRLIVASIVTKPSARGLTIDDLLVRLQSRISDPKLAFRVEETIALTLGDRWNETASLRFAPDVASRTIAFYDAVSIPRVNPNVPPEVSQVRFAVELDAAPTLERSVFPGLGALSDLRGRFSASGQ